MSDPVHVTIDWVEYGTRPQSTHSPGAIEDMRLLGWSRDFTKRLPLLDLKRFTPFDPIFGIGAGDDDAHWERWPASFRGGLQFRAVEGAPNERWFVLGYVAGEREERDRGRYTTRALWYLLPNDWFRGFQSQHVHETQARLLAAIRKLVDRERVQHAQRGEGNDERVVVEVSRSDTITEFVREERDPDVRALERFARTEDHLVLPAVRSPIDPRRYLVLLIGAAMRGAGDADAFVRIAQRGIGVLCAPKWEERFGWCVPNSVPVSLRDGPSLASSPSASARLAVEEPFLVPQSRRPGASSPVIPAANPSIPSNDPQVLSTPAHRWRLVAVAGLTVAILSLLFSVLAWSAVGDMEQRLDDVKEDIARVRDEVEQARDEATLAKRAAETAKEAMNPATSQSSSTPLSEGVDGGAGQDAGAAMLKQHSASGQPSGPKYHDGGNH